MVRRGRSYGTSAQREGRSAGQRQARNLRRHKESLRAANKTHIVVGSKPIRLHVDGRAGAEVDDYAMYSVVREDGEWVLRALCVTETRETVKRRNGWPSGSSTDVVSRHLVSVQNDGRGASDGFELKRFETKADALQYANAETSERVESGVYVIRPGHLETNYKGYPRTCRDTVDRDELGAFKRRAMRVYE